MNVREALSLGVAALDKGRSGSPNLDASLLLALALGCPRERLLAMLPDPVEAREFSEFMKLVERRNGGESVAYIVGHKEFYGRNFLVDSRVLVPRPDTEILVDAALARLPPPHAGLFRCHDAFAGSGCIGITLACERPDLQVELSDSSPDALEVCAKNARLLCSRTLPVSLGDVLSAAAGYYTLITANPPYVTTALTDAIIEDGGREPRAALDGGLDGMALYERLTAEAWPRLLGGGWLLAEIGDEQGSAVSAILRNAGFSSVEVIADLAGHDRVAAGVKP